MDSSYFQKKRRLEQHQQDINKYGTSHKIYTPKDPEYWEPKDNKVRVGMFQRDEENMTEQQQYEWTHNSMPVVIMLSLFGITMVGIMIFLIILQLFGGI